MMTLTKTLMLTSRMTIINTSSFEKIMLESSDVAVKRARLTRQRFEIVIIDGGSKDGIYELKW